MTFNPEYTITPQLLANIKRVTALVTELNCRHFLEVVTIKLEERAREESVYSSTSIEGNPLPLTEVKKILKSLPENARDSEKEVINYNNALMFLNGSKAQFSLPLILDIHKRVTLGLMLEHECGKLRKKPVVVNDPRKGAPVYLPPDVEDVRPLMQDLVTFVAASQKVVDPLILAGIFHKQMVIIHPFMDGNGRTTRLTTKLLLSEMGLNTFRLFSFESYYNQNVTRYFQTVGEFGNYYDLVENIDFTPWLEYFTGGLIDELLRVQKLLVTAQVASELLKPYDHIILAEIKSKGYITEQNYALLVDRGKSARAQDLHRLVELNLIEPKGAGRSTRYIMKGED
ncbi:MAG: hypothetical protein C0410_04225 [Anaerolinea sp.]|nr:hypothetical protein [Anaerolinea sp.]